MATSLLALLDDIATLLDDISVMTKVAAKKTAGVLGDDLALNAHQITGVNPDRELPVVWAVAKGSFKNKAILVPSALLISAFIPSLIIILLIIGGAFLCYEGFEKIIEKFLYHHVKDKIIAADIVNNPIILEKDKINGAIRTDFILSAEIIVITLGTVSNMVFMNQVLVLISISILMTVGVYGLVAGIVKLDDLGLHIVRKSIKHSFKYKIGRFILNLAPYLMKLLAVLGTIAMFMVGGSIIAHNIPIFAQFSHDIIHFFESNIANISFLNIIISSSIDLIFGFIIGAAVFLIVELIKKIIKK